MLYISDIWWSHHLPIKKWNTLPSQCSNKVVMKTYNIIVYNIATQRAKNLDLTTFNPVRARLDPGMVSRLCCLLQYCNWTHILQGTHHILSLNPQLATTCTITVHYILKHDGYVVTSVALLSCVASHSGKFMAI